MDCVHNDRLPLALASWLGGFLCVVVGASCGGSSPDVEEPVFEGSEVEGAGGESAADSEYGAATGIEVPPGSVEPDDEDEEAPRRSAQEQPAAAATGARPSAAVAVESPWGAPEAESGEPLPPRRPMTAQAGEAYREGVLAAGAGNVAGARAAFLEAVDADPRAYRAIFNLGVLADRSGQESRALDYYRQALRIQPDYERAVEGVVAISVRRGNAAEAVAFVEPLARRWARSLYIQAIYADALVQADRADDAAAAARRALQRDERFVPAMIALAKANLRRGRTELAQSVLEQAERVTDANAEIHFLKGRMLGDQGRLGESMIAYQRAVELRPDYAEARMALGVQSLRGGNYPESVAQFEAVRQLVPTLVSVHLNLGEAYRASKQWRPAKESFDRALEMATALPEAHFNLGLLYLSAGADYPGPDLLTALQRAVAEFNTYRNEMGPMLARNDLSQGYLEDLQRRIEREQKRIERDRLRAERERTRQAREAEQPVVTADGQQVPEEGGSPEPAAPEQTPQAPAMPVSP